MPPRRAPARAAAKAADEAIVNGDAAKPTAAARTSRQTTASESISERMNANNLPAPVKTKALAKAKGYEFHILTEAQLT